MFRAEIAPFYAIAVPSLCEFLRRHSIRKDHKVEFFSQKTSHKLDWYSFFLNISLSMKKIEESRICNSWITPFPYSHYNFYQAFLLKY